MNTIDLGMNTRDEPMDLGFARGSDIKGISLQGLHTIDDGAIVNTYSSTQSKRYLTDRIIHFGSVYGPNSSSTTCQGNSTSSPAPQLVKQPRL